MRKGKDPRRPFFLLATQLLSDSPDDLSSFESFWKAEEYRLAYAFLHKILERRGDELDRSVDEAFYWEFVN
jgi:hypothetical protein